MRHRGQQGRLFHFALVGSVVAHAALPLIPGSSRVEAAEAVLEERDAREPMTVRIVVPEAVVEAVSPRESLMTSERGTRSVAALDVEPQRFERAVSATQPTLARQPTQTPIAPELVPVSTALDPSPTSLAPPLDPLPLERAPTAIHQKSRSRVDVPLAGPEERDESSAALVARKASAASSSNRAPQYPALAQRQRLEGTCTLIVRVSATGRVLDVRVKSSTGHTMLDKSATKAVRRWRFEPAVGTDGRPTEDTVEVPVVFRLAGRKR